MTFVYVQANISACRRLLMRSKNFSTSWKRRDGGTLEYVFDSDAQSVLQTVTKEKVAEIAADFMTTYYGVQVGALETQELRQQPIPFWLVCFSDTVKGSLRQLFFVIVLPDGTIVEPRVTKRQ